MRIQASKNGKVVVYRVPEGTSEDEKKALDKEAKLLAGYEVNKKRNIYRTVYQARLFK